MNRDRVLNFFLSWLAYERFHQVTYHEGKRKKSRRSTDWNDKEERETNERNEADDEELLQERMKIDSDYWYILKLEKKMIYYHFEYVRVCNQKICLFLIFKNVLKRYCYRLLSNIFMNHILIPDEWFQEVLSCISKSLSSKINSVSVFFSQLSRYRLTQQKWRSHLS